MIWRTQVVVVAAGHRSPGTLGMPLSPSPGVPLPAWCVMDTWYPDSFFDDAICDVLGACAGSVAGVRFYFGSRIDGEYVPRSAVSKPSVAPKQSATTQSSSSVAGSRSGISPTSATPGGGVSQARAGAVSKPSVRPGGSSSTVSASNMRPVVADRAERAVSQPGSRVDAKAIDAAVTPEKRAEIVAAQGELEAAEQKLRDAPKISLSGVPAAERGEMQRFRSMQDQSVKRQITELRSAFVAEHSYVVDADGTAYAASVDSKHGNLELARTEQLPASAGQPATVVMRSAVIATDRSRVTTSVEETAGAVAPGEVKQKITMTVRSDPAGKVTGSSERVDQERVSASGGVDRASQQRDFDGSGTITRELVASSVKPAGGASSSVVSDTDFDASGAPVSTYVHRSGSVPEGAPRSEYVAWKSAGVVGAYLTSAAQQSKAQFERAADSGDVPTAARVEHARAKGEGERVGGIVARDANAVQDGVAVTWSRGDDNRFTAGAGGTLLAKPLQPSATASAVFSVPAAVRARASAAAIDQSKVATDPAAFAELSQQQADFEEQLSKAGSDAQRKALMSAYFAKHDYWIDRSAGGAGQPVLMASAWSEGVPQSSMFGSSRAANAHATMARTGIAGSDDLGQPATVDMVHNMYVDGTRDQITRTSATTSHGGSRVVVSGQHINARGVVTELDRNAQSLVVDPAAGSLVPTAVTEITKERFDGVSGKPRGEQYYAVATSTGTVTSLEEKRDTYSAAGVITDTKIESVQMTRNFNLDATQGFFADNNRIIDLAHTDTFNPNADGASITVPPVGSSYQRSLTDVDYNTAGKAIYQEVDETSWTVERADDETRNGVRVTRVETERITGSRTGTAPILDASGSRIANEQVTTTIATSEFDPDAGYAGGNNGVEHQLRTSSTVTMGATVTPAGTSTGNWATPFTTRTLREGFDDDWVYEQKLLKTTPTGEIQTTGSGNDARPIELTAGDEVRDATGALTNLTEGSVNHSDLDNADKFESFMEGWGGKILGVAAIAAGIAGAVFTGGASLALTAVGVGLASANFAHTYLNHSQGEASGWDLALAGAGVALSALPAIRGVQTLSTSGRAAAMAKTATEARAVNTVMTTGNIAGHGLDGLDAYDAGRAALRGDFYGAAMMLGALGVGHAVHARYSEPHGRIAGASGGGEPIMHSYEPSHPSPHFEPIDHPSGWGVAGTADAVRSSAGSVASTKPRSEYVLPKDVIAEFEFPQQRMQHSFKHADDFGVSVRRDTNNKVLAPSKSEQAAFEQALRSHIDNPETIAYQGTFKPKSGSSTPQQAYIYVDTATGNMAAFDMGGSMLAAYRLNDGQLGHLYGHGSVGHTPIKQLEALKARNSNQLSAGSTSSTAPAAPRPSGVTAIQPTMLDDNVYARIQREAGLAEHGVIDIQVNQRRPLVDAEVDAVMGQAGLWHRDVNTALRSGQPVDGQMHTAVGGASGPQLGAHVELVDGAIESSAFGAPARLYRGISMDEPSFRQMLATGSVTDPAYMSTTRQPRTAAAFARDTRMSWEQEGESFSTPSGPRTGRRPVVFELEVAEGQRGLDLSRISHENEHEVLLPRGSRIDVADVRIDSDGAAIVRGRILPAPSAAPIPAGGSPSPSPGAVAPSRVHGPRVELEQQRGRMEDGTPYDIPAYRADGIAEYDLDGITYRIESSGGVLSPSEQAQFDMLRRQVQNMPPELRRSVHTINVYAGENPADSFWRREYNNLDHVSAATGGNGSITYWNGHVHDDHVLYHEATHARTWTGGPASEISWRAASVNDQRRLAQLQKRYGSRLKVADGERVLSLNTNGESVSDYGFQALHSRAATSAEDFADAGSLFFRNRQGQAIAHLESFWNRLGFGRTREMSFDELFPGRAGEIRRTFGIVDAADGARLVSREPQSPPQVSYTLRRSNGALDSGWEWMYGDDQAAVFAKTDASGQQLTKRVPLNVDFWIANDPSYLASSRMMVNVRRSSGAVESGWTVTAVEGTRARVDGPDGYKFVELADLLSWNS